MGTRLHSSTTRWGLQHASLLLVRASRQPADLGTYDQVCCRHLVVLLEADDQSVPPAAPLAGTRKAPLLDAEIEQRVAYMLARGMRVSHDTAK